MCLEQTLDYVKNSPYIDSISINFHTPFSETEDLYLDPAIRNQLINRLIEYKRNGYPIVNTISGLKAMRIVHGKTACTNRSCWITNFIFSDGSRAPKCMGYVKDVCDRCGFSMGGEMRSVWLLKIDTLSEPLSEFINTCIEPDDKGTVTTAERLEGFRAFCTKRNWLLLPQRYIENNLPEYIYRAFGLSKRTDIKRNGRNNRGYYGLRLKNV